MRIIYLAQFLLSTSLFAAPLSTERLQAIAGEVPYVSNDKDGWDRRYSSPSYLYGKKPADFLLQNIDYFPPKSKVLDIGMGEGRNAVYLARQGHDVLGIDISSVAAKKANMLANENKVRIRTLVASALKYNFKKESFDVIICFYYVNKKLLSRMRRWLRPGGMIVFESFTYKHPGAASGEISKESLVRSQDLIGWFKSMRILKYEEPIHKNKFTASIIVQKTKG